MKQILVGFLLAVCLMHSASAIKCYQCKSLTDPNCAEEKIDASSRIREVDCDMVPRPNVMDQLLPVTKCNKVVTSANAIRCYRCETATNPNCALEKIYFWSNVPRVNCNLVPKPLSTEELLPVTKCKKVISPDGERNMVVSRDCHFEVKPTVRCDVPNEAQRSDEGTVGTVETRCHICYKDYCNASAVDRFVNTAVAALIASVVTAQLVL